jgi:hypothetical protein
VYYTLRAAAGNVGGDDEFSDGRQSPILHAMNQRLAEHYFDDFVEGQCQPFVCVKSEWINQ